MTLQRGIAYVALCLISASGWLLDAYAPGLEPGLFRQALHDGLLCLVFGGAAMFWERQRPHLARRAWIGIAGWGAALFALPVIVGTSSAGAVSGLATTLVFTCVPVVVVFLLAQRDAGFGATESRLQLLGPALAGVGGAALILPFSLPDSSRGAFWLGAIVVATIVSAVAAIELHDRLQAAGVLAAAALICGSTALVAASFVAIHVGAIPPLTRGIIALEVGRAMLIAGPIVLLTVWLLGRLTPAQMSSRYLVVPLISAFGAAVMLRPGVTWTLLAGMALMAGGGAMLLKDPTRISAADQPSRQAE